MNYDRFERFFLESLVKKVPNDSLIWEQLGELYSRSGEKELALKADLEASKLLPESPNVHYNLACSFAQLGQEKFALEHLEQAMQLGFQDLQWMEKDRDLDPLRNLPEFIQLMKSFHI